MPASVHLAAKRKRMMDGNVAPFDTASQVQRMCGQAPNRRIVHPTILPLIHLAVAEMLTATIIKIEARAIATMFNPIKFLLEMNPMLRATANKLGRGSTVLHGENALQHSTRETLILYPDHKKGKARIELKQRRSRNPHVLQPKRNLPPHLPPLACDPDFVILNVD